MPDIYSPALLAALPAVGLSLVAAALSRWKPETASLANRSKWSRAAGRSAVLAAVATLAAVASHLALGHPPGSEAALGPLRFVAEHPVVLGIVTGLVLARLLVPASERNQIADGDR
ncbi:MAG: hypothetical protein R3244_12760 [Thermoanaerobaculia bacterium]|nr:hypothetical protein [Thermoanaerobaculia bacterium]